MPRTLRVSEELTRKELIDPQLERWFTEKEVEEVVEFANKIAV